MSYLTLAQPNLASDKAGSPVPDLWLNSLQITVRLSSGKGGMSLSAISNLNNQRKGL